MSKQSVDIESMTAKAREKFVLDSLAGGMKNIKQAALAFAVMVKNRENISMIPACWVGFLTQLAANKAIPELIQLRGWLHRKVLMMPVAEQRKIVAGVKVTYVTADDVETRLDPRMLTPRQVLQVFGAGFVRSAAEQREYIDAGVVRPVKPDLTVDMDILAKIKAASSVVLVLSNGVKIHVTKREMGRLLEQYIGDRLEDLTVTSKKSTLYITGLDMLK